jgi:RHS repeat-associated protein
MFTTLKHWLGQLKTQAKAKMTLSQPVADQYERTSSTQTKSALAMSALVTLLSLSVIGTAHAATGSRSSAFEYDPVSGLLVKEIIEPGDSNLCLVTTYTYDSFGNKNSATTRNCNGSAGSHPGTNSEAAAPTTATPAGADAIIVSRTSTTTYDSKGQFPISSTNALNQTETKTYNPNFGTVATLVGPNTLTTSWTYDSFGKPLTEARADGTSTSTSYDLCTTCPTVGTAVTKYTITTTQAGAPYSKTYYDQEGRAIQTETQDKDGALILSQVQYDNLGRTSKTSRPFKAGVTPVWNTVAYDKMNRPVSNTAPNNTVTNITYNGYTTIATNALSQTKTEIKNSQGQLVTVTDTQAKSLTYQYDAFGNLTQTKDALNNITTITYDARGRKVGMDDPDQGVWSYQYDALGQLKKQTDAKLQNVTFTYDKLGRMLTRNEPDLISTWAYDTCVVDALLQINNSAGKCIGKPVKESTDNGYVRFYLYDSYGRHTAELDNVDQGYGVTKSFDAQGRVSTLVYPSGNGFNYQTQNIYSTTGHLSQVKELVTNVATAQVTSNAVIWTAGATDNEGRVTTTTYGNTVTNTTVFDTLTGRITQVQAGASNSVSNQSFVYDNLGNLTQRYDQVTNLNEAFGYDSLNRLTSTSAQAGTGPLTQTTVTYNAIGNIMSKSDVGTYTYASLKANGLARPHAVSQIMMNDGTTIYANYTYDANGNTLTSLDATSKGRTITWNSFNMPINITGNKPATSNPALLSTTPISTTSSSFGFVYNASHERVKETLPDGTIVYNVSPRVDTGIHVEKRVKLNGEISYNYSLYAGALPFGVHTVTKLTPSSTATVTNRYYHTDHLGSIIAISNDAGTVVERRSYDAWGKRRNLNGTSLANAFVTSDVRYAFGGHEDLGELGLIHMNGRIYDPATGRFLSADPTIELPDDMQNYNRYSYINNNPLSAIDYSGYGWNPFKAVSRLFKSIGKAIKAVLHNSVIRTVVAIVAAYYTGGALYGAYLGSAVSAAGGAMAITGAQFASAAFTASIISGAGAGFVGAFIASGGNIKAGLAGAVGGAISGGIMGYYGSNYPFSRVAANGVANGVSAKIQGGNFMEGLRSGLITSAFTYGNVQMRQAMIQSSLGNPINNGYGLSNGMFGDFFKLAGERLNELKVKLGDIAGGPLGGAQSGQGRLFFYHYEKGGFVDMVLESFAGPHDFANSPHFYNPTDGTGITATPGFRSKLLEFSTNMTSSLAFATPFAAAAAAEQSNYSAYRYAK